MQNKGWLVCLVLMMVLFSCGNDQYYLPKPKSYFRIDLPDKKYESFKSELPFTFEKPIFSVLEKRAVSKDQFNLVYPLHKAKIHFTYLDLDSKDVQSFLEDAYNYAYTHNQKATAIKTQNKVDTLNQVYGLVYDLKGDVASSLQFYLTDSTDHFLRGALYFSHVPNADSIQPVLEYIKEDVDHIYKTLEWK
ncbi:MAG: gliding motility lipoprotein GldD [Flavobacteriales bacterium]